jgi:uncharacterized protein
MTGPARGVTVTFGAPLRMSDGVALRANIYRPEGHGPWPTLLARTPYGKDLAQVVSWLDPVQTAKRGFMVLIQDTRGRFASGGEWDPFKFEREDGYEAVQWAASLPGSNGRVGMYGGSYWGNSQWLAALAQPPALHAIAPAVTWSDPMDGLFARGGAVELGLALPWTLQQGLDRCARTAPSADVLQRRVAAILDDWDSLDRNGYWDLPVRKIAVLQRHAVPDLGSIRVLDDPGIADRCRVAGLHDRVLVPTFNLGGWYDIFLQGTLDNFAAMTALGRPSRLIVGPWTHPTYADPIGDLLFGVRAGKDGIPVHPYGDVNDFQLAFLRQHLEPDSGVELPDSPVRIFVMGRNQWRDENDWPLRRAKSVRWFLHVQGSLATDPPTGVVEPSGFVYDPLDPVPTVGGNTVMWSGYPAGPFDQRRIEDRKDVLVFTSAPLERELEVTGRIKAVIHAESTAPATDWVVRLCDVYPDGRSINVCDGILRVPKHAQSPGPYEIDLWSTSIVFLPGHRLRVHLTSSSFPRWDRNLNTGRQDAADHAVAHQRVHHSADRVSYIELPVVE